MSSFVMSTLPSSAKADSAPHEKTTRITFAGRKKNAFDRTRPNPADVENINSILVTVGTISRTDRIDEDWEHEDARYSSDNADADAIKMQKVPSEGSETRKSMEARSSMEKTIPDSEPLQLPLTTMPSPVLPHPYAPHLGETSSWKPRTPEGDPPTTLLPPGQLTRHAKNGSLQLQPNSRVADEDDAPWRQL